MNEIAKRFVPSEIEAKWYQHWTDRKYFSSKPDEREPYSIVIPPPNVTGVLHMGHILNNTIQDILIREARMDGKNACWVPGMDHASIATEAKVVRMLREKGIKKSDLTREEFLEHAWEWKEKYGGIILKQLKTLGASCDWDRTAFTMDKVRSEAVIRVFIDMYKKGKLYRGLRMINWDPEAKTVLSNEEVIYHVEQTSLYHVKYEVVDANGTGTGDWVTVATTRPETILGDTAIAVHPKDEKYKPLVGKSVNVPLVNRVVPIIFDEYVDREFGTGALKITPAHDVNDYEIGKKHNLETIDVINDDGSISEAGQFFIGMDRFDARKAMVKELESLGQLVEVEQYTHNVGRSERTNAVIEPKLSLQWFVDMKQLVDPALKAVVDGEVDFFPENMKNTYRHWMENIRDWCISRQLWWGHRIPAYYINIDGEEKVFVGTDEDEVIKEARTDLGRPDLQMSELRQDEDVLDTWFSSWLWPITVFDGFNNKEEIDYYYPTNVLVTGWDIIFLWVARMIMAGYEWKNERPFDHVYFTGMVRDKQGRKMSKQLGNSPDALKLIADYGADGVRFGIMYSSPAGGDLLFDDSHCEQGRNFCNKIWNALRLVKGWEVKEGKAPESNELAINWFESISQQVIGQVDEKMQQYRLSEGLVLLYKYVWGDFCSSYLEMIKPPFGEKIDEETYKRTISFFERICSLLHPFMPFITEEVWHQLENSSRNEDCMLSKYPVSESYDRDVISLISTILDVKTKVLELRNNKSISFKEKLDFGYVQDEEAAKIWKTAGAKALLTKMSNVSFKEMGEELPDNAISFVSGTSKYFVIMEQEIDVEAELAKLQVDLDYVEGFVKSVQKKLNNERFVSNAPEVVVEKERQKLSDGLSRSEQLKEAIEELKSRK